MARLLPLSVLILLAGCSSPWKAGLEYHRRGELAAAEDAYREAGDHPLALFNLACLLHDRNPAEALRLYRKSVSLDPTLHGAWLNAAPLVASQIGSDSAIVWATRACRALPDDPDIFLSRARLLLAAGEDSSAVADLRAALLRQPSEPEALALLLPLVAGAEAERIATNLGQLQLSDARAAALVGEKLLERGELAAALTQLTRAHQLAPANGQILVDLARCHAALDQNGDALTALWQAEERGVSNADTARLAAQLLRREWKRVEALGRMGTK